MTSPLNAQLARVLIDPRLRTAQDHHRAPRTRTYSMPIVREIPRPAERDAPARTGW